MLESRNVVKRYGGKTAVDGISLALKPGQIYAMLGPNGSGKTTWMKMAAGLTLPTAGEIFFEGRRIGVETRRSVAYMATEPYFYPWMSVKDVGRYYGDFFEDYDPEAFRSLLKEMELTEDLKVKSLSSGMAAKLKIAVTLARRAKVYLLDEPFNGIDLLARDAILRAILAKSGEDNIMVLSSHLVEEMEALASAAIYIREGKLALMKDLEQMREEDGCSMAEMYRKIYGQGGDVQ